MITQGSRLRSTGAWLLAVLLGFAVLLLWQPRTESQARGAAPDSTLTAPVKPVAEKLLSGKGQRSALAAKAGGEDRSPGPQPGVAAGAPLTAIAGAPLRATATLATPDLRCPRGAPCGRHTPRAPPRA